MPPEGLTQQQIDRTQRYRDIIAPEHLLATECAVVGVGAVGHQIALMLAGMGIGHLTLYDPDKVEGANLGPQRYEPGAIGRPKVYACEDECITLNPELDIGVCHGPSDEDNLPEGLVVFLCVDTMAARRSIAEGLYDQGSECGLLIDIRMAAEEMQVISAKWPFEFTKYQETLFHDSEAPEAPCGARATPYCSSIAASLAVHQMTQFLRDQDLHGVIALNLQAMVLATSPLVIRGRRGGAAGGPLEKEERLELERLLVAEAQEQLDNEGGRVPGV